MSRIHLLPDPLVSQIAAGEVVERPASVVKELIENALDAGAGDVEVQLEAGGRGRIAVADDGCGMGGDDALLAFDRHATSKIASFADLERVATLGFRGEALAAIASVARVELTTAERPGEGHRVLIEGGRVRLAEPLARPRGTTLDVRSLFFNVPARRKFLKSPETELRRALEVVQGYSLARAEVRWRVLHEGRALLDALPAAGAEGPRQRIAQLFGAELAARLAPIGEPAEEMEKEAGRERIGGLVGSPETARGRRQFVFVNRRLLRDRAVLAAFYRVVREEWKSDDFPALFLFLDLPPEELDVNVHPQKAEVRFRDPRLLDRVAEALRRGLARARGEVAAPLRRPGGAPAAPFAWQGLGARPNPAAWWDGGAHGAPSEPPRSPGAPPPGLLRPGQSPPPSAAAGEVAEAAAPVPPGWRWQPTWRLAAPSYAPPERAAVPLSGRRGEARPFRLLGQYKGTLILLEGPDGLYLIDQHVAHERILYERLRRSLAAAAPASQALLAPLLLELGPAERLRLLELAPGLEACGFGLTALSGQTLALTAVPAPLSAGEAEALLVALAGDPGEGSEGAEAAEGVEGSQGAKSVEGGKGGSARAASAKGSQSAKGAKRVEGAEPAEGSEDAERAQGEAGALTRRVLDALAASLACKGAVKMHHPLSPPEMEALVTELFAAEQPFACPHGRPIVLQMTDSDLERRFGRR
jgi:DNA mismatch repair protein MutL